MLVAMDLAMRLNDAAAALQAAVSCYGLLAPVMFHQITCDSVVEVCNNRSHGSINCITSIRTVSNLYLCLCSDVQVLKKCLMVLEENSGLLKQKWTENIPESFMHMIASITYYLAKVCVYVVCMFKNIKLV